MIFISPAPRAIGGILTISPKHFRFIAASTVGCYALLVVTEWNEFREPDFKRMKKLMKHPVIFDGRNIYNPAQVRELGFTYASIGRP